MKILKCTPAFALLILLVPRFSVAADDNSALKAAIGQAEKISQDRKTQSETSRTERTATKPGHWTRMEEGVAYITLFGYKLKNNVRASFETGGIFGSPSITYFGKTFFGRTVVSSGFWLGPNFRNDLGCFADVAGDGEHVSSFVLKTVVPGFVSKSLGYGNRDVQMVATTKITAVPNCEACRQAESEIQMLDADGRLLDTLHDTHDAYPALIDSYQDFTVKSIQCK